MHRCPQGAQGRRKAVDGSGRLLCDGLHTRGRALHVRWLQGEGQRESEPAMRHDTGDGWVAAHDGHYAPAITAGRRVTVLVAEVTGGMSDSIIATVM